MKFGILSGYRIIFLCTLLEKLSDAIDQAKLVQLEEPRGSCSVVFAMRKDVEENGDTAFGIFEIIKTTRPPNEGKEFTRVNCSTQSSNPSLLATTMGTGKLFF